MIFLGAGVPLEFLKSVMRANKIRNVLFFMERLSPVVAAQKYLNEVQQVLSATKIHLAGNAVVVNKLMLGKNINRINSLEEFESKIQNSPLYERNVR